MTVDEFKEKYPEYKNLEGDNLWDIMGDILLTSKNVLTADPNRKIFYHEPVEINDIKWFVEDDNKTVWLNNKGEKVLIKNQPIFVHPTESYRLEIIDFGKV